jgi:hypothetical protein
MAPQKSGLQPGDYAMHRGGIVRLDSYANGRWWICYCQFWARDHREPFPVSGGQSGFWPEDSSDWGVSPITDPILKIRALLSVRRDRIAELERELQRARQDRDRYAGVLLDLIETPPAVKPEDVES